VVDRRPVMLVTGASRGIGAAVALAAAADHDVVLAHTGASDIGELLARVRDVSGALAIDVVADMGDEGAIVAMFARIDDELGPVDVLVNNAGIAGAYGELACVTGEMMARLFAVNVTGPFLCAREAAARMSTRNGGRGGSIVNISSKAAVIGGAGEWVHYAATKGAIDTMTSGLARELAPQGIRVNAVRPGLIASDFHDHAPPGRLERMAPMIPMLRAGTTDEVAAAVIWLASSAASYTTGTFLDVTGGR